MATAISLTVFTIRRNMISNTTASFRFHLNIHYNETKCFINFQVLTLYTVYIYIYICVYIYIYIYIKIMFFRLLCLGFKVYCRFYRSKRLPVRLPQTNYISCLTTTETSEPVGNVRRTSQVEAALSGIHEH